MPSQYRDGQALFFVSRKHPPLLPEVCGYPLATPLWIIVPTWAISSSAEGQGLQLEANIIPGYQRLNGIVIPRPWCIFVEPIELKSISIAKLLVATALLGSSCPVCLGQTAPVRIYLTNPAEENWSFLKDQSKRADFWDPLKYISLGAEDRFLTLSGEIRFRPEGFRIRGVGDIPSTLDSYFLQRYLLGAIFT